MMKRTLLLLTTAVVTVLIGCAMFKSWKSIPPPGGCEQCHHVPISYDWVLVYEPVTLNDETGQYAWQRPESMQPLAPPEQLEQQKISEQRCFRCHKGPNEAHSGFSGRYHH